MSVVASFMYRDGKREEELPLSATPISLKKNEFAWIRAVRAVGRRDG